MASPSKPSEICALVPSGTSSLCDRIQRALIQLPQKLCDDYTWAVNDDRTLTDAFKLAAQFSNLFCSASGGDAYVATSTDVEKIWGSNYGDGISRAAIVPVKFLNSNTSAATLNLNGTGAQPIRKNVSEELAFGDIAAGSIHILVWDRTQWQVITRLQSGAGTRSTILTSGFGNFTVPSAVSLLDVECVGGGGGGGGNASATGGGGGGYCVKRMSVVPGSVIAYSVGAVGSASTGNNAGDGGDTAFGTMSAGGGKNGDAGLGVGGIATGGDININGADGFGQGDSRGATDKCEGGDSQLGRGGWYSSSAVGHSPTGFGAGGYGDVVSGGGWQSSDGGPGIIIIKY